MEDAEIPNSRDIRSILNFGDVPDIRLSFNEYNFSGADIEIQKPLNMTSTINTHFICQKIVILSPDVCISGFKFSCSIIIYMVDNISIKNCSFDDGDAGCGGTLVITRGNGIILENLILSNITIPAIFVETNSSVFIKDCRIFNVSDSMIYISNVSQAVIENCELYQTENNGIVATLDSIIEVNNTEIHHTASPAILVINSSLFCTNSNFHDIQQNGIYVNHCNEAKFMNNKFQNIKSSCISVSLKSNAFVYENTFEDIGGNAVFMVAESKATILKNIVKRSSYPAFAILQKCSAQISYNEISDMQKAGICIRGASRAVLDANKIENVNDCGISISDSFTCVLFHNFIKNCAVAGFEAYNQACAKMYGNEFEECGEYGIMVYTSANVSATKNKFKGISNAFVHLSTNGSGTFSSNDIINCEKQVDGNTTGVFLFKDNISFESITNDENNVDFSVKIVPKFVDPMVGKCMKCLEGQKQGYCAPCGHKVLCDKCGKAAADAHENCPLCRFEIKSYTDEFPISDSSQCSICLEAPADSIVLPCGHTGFCAECLNVWFLEQNSCPACRGEPSVFRKIISDF
ncbi:hypothetical protein TRFO_11733 [Tritrichomonas foetus]|uniref:RING-type domain-containing protein n=1 Tax=Tritrichomonas foetus TaxID=1144522 RepID=A0A1J4J216_9EUKA|nr:hypothetical protein TRFO_11733 [Tritrichomonas foetus]|eukprot:OHS93526.1 hypothetical protein TRFO_11733 [Tritrichomonas foetus]